MKSLALAAIRFYQRVISPRKGFCCAFRACTGHASCSTFGYRAIRRHGVWDGLAILRLRLTACGAVYESMRKAPARRALQSQAGSCDCDLPCDCDAKSCNTASDCGSNLCECDWPSRKRNREDLEAERRRRQRIRRGET